MQHRSESPQAHRQSLALKAQLRAELAAAKVQQKAVAFEAGVDPGTICRWLSDEHHEALPAWMLPIWGREVGGETLAYIARHCGYELVPVGTVQPVAGLPILTGSLSAQAGKLVQQLIQALEDGKLDAAEQRALAPDIYRLRATLDGVQRHVGGGAQ